MLNALAPSADRERLFGGWCTATGCTHQSARAQTHVGFAVKHTVQWVCVCVSRAFFFFLHFFCRYWNANSCTQCTLVESKVTGGPGDMQLKVIHISCIAGFCKVGAFAWAAVSAGPLVSSSRLKYLFTLLHLPLYLTSFNQGWAYKHHIYIS